MATPHDERMKQFNELIDAASRILKARHAAQAATKEEEKETKEA